MFAKSKEFYLTRLWNFLGNWKGYSTKTNKICSNTGNYKQEF